MKGSLIKIQAAENTTIRTKVHMGQKYNKLQFNYLHFEMITEIALDCMPPCLTYRKPFYLNPFVRVRTSCNEKHSPASEMPNTSFWIFWTVLTIEATLICLGNAFTIFVFWHQRASFKRAWYLLINLAVADLLVGLTVLTHKLTYKPSRRLAHADDIFSSFFLLFATVSLLCLTVISLERVYAVLWPLRYRVASTRTYIISIVLVWTGGFCTATLEVIKSSQIIREKSSNLVINSLFFTSLVVVLGAYLTIRKRLKSPNHLAEAKIGGLSNRM